MDGVEIPDKLYFTIGDVCRLLKLEPYVLRFWGKEFPQLTPTKGANGRRMYRRRDVETALAIKNLLYDQGFTIAGARKVLGEKRPMGPARPAGVEVISPRSHREHAASGPSPLSSEALQQLKSDLRSILTILNRRC